MAKRTHRATACKLRPGAFTGTDRVCGFSRPLNPLCLYIPFQHIGKRDAIDVSIDRSPHATPESAGLASLRVVAFPLVIDACIRLARAFRSALHIADADLVCLASEIVTAAHAANALQHIRAHERAA